jgi:hypothetical protein
MKRIAIAALALGVIATVAGCSTTPATSGTAPTAAGNAAQASAQVLPVSSNPISNTSTAPGLAVTAVAAENNTDPATGAAISDRLQVTIQNSTGKPVTNLEVYYTMKDATTGAAESYYQPLTGLTIAPNSSTTVNFDNGTGPGHYPENKFSIYRSSANRVDFTVEVSAPGLKVATGTGSKGPGTGETAGG